MPFTKVQIISNALTLLGKGPITTISEAGEFAQAVEQAFDYLYPSAISKNAWRFATKIQQLSLTVDTPLVDRWQYIYQLPPDYLSLVRLYNNTLDFQIYEDKLYTNVGSTSPIYIEYRFLPEVTALPSYFVEFFTYLLAENYATSISNQEHYIQIMSQKARLSLSEALAADSQSHPNEGIKHYPYINVRGGCARYCT